MYARAMYGVQKNVRARRGRLVEAEYKGNCKLNKAMRVGLVRSAHCAIRLRSGEASNDQVSEA